MNGEMALSPEGSHSRLQITRGDVQPPLAGLIKQVTVGTLGWSWHQQGPDGQHALFSGQHVAIARTDLELGGVRSGNLLRVK